MSKQFFTDLLHVFVSHPWNGRRTLKRSRVWRHTHENQFLMSLRSGKITSQNQSKEQWPRVHQVIWKEVLHPN